MCVKTYMQYTKRVGNFTTRITFAISTKTTIFHYFTFFFYNFTTTTTACWVASSTTDTIMTVMTK